MDGVKLGVGETVGVGEFATNLNPLFTSSGDIIISCALNCLKVAIHY
jgi:hypothetical protein